MSLAGRVAAREARGDAQRSPLRAALAQQAPPEAVYSGRIAEDCTFIIVLSYCWASPEHPDPENRLLANVSEFLAYLDVTRHFAGGPASMAVKVADREVLVFWDWPCLYQKKDGGITPQQLYSFKRGLQSVNVLYGHVGTLCLLCTEGHYPPGSRPDYKGSGWPYFESLVSTLVKDQNKSVDLPRALEWVRKTGADTRERDANRSIYWLYEYVRRAERQLPVSPDVFDREIMHKRVTNGNDKQVLKDKFRETFLAVMNPAKKISLQDVPGPSSVEWRLFLQETLRVCPRLQHIDLSCNESIREATLEPFAALGATLEVLDVGMCVGFAGTLDALKHLRKLRGLFLFGCVDLEGTLAPLGNLQELVKLNVEACFGLQGGVHVLATLPKLQNLNTSDTRLDVEGFVAAGACRVGRWGNEQTPLWYAANCGQAYTARRLLEGTADWRGVEVDRATTDDGTTPLRQAAFQRFPEVVKVLLQHGADVDKASLDGDTPLHCASQVGSVEVAEVLLECRADVNKTNMKRETPLDFAAHFGHLAVVRLLLQSRADVDKADHDGTTPLHFAAQKGSVEVAEVLLESRANVTMTDTTKETPLHLAAYFGHVAVVRLLLQSPADTTLKTQWGLTPLVVARREGREEVAMLLVQAEEGGAH